MISTKRLFKYCCENPTKIENYNIAAEDTSAVWEVHHRLETISHQIDHWSLDVLEITRAPNGAFSVVKKNFIPDRCSS